MRPYIDIAQTSAGSDTAANQLALKVPSTWTFEGPGEMTTYPSGKEQKLQHQKRDLKSIFTTSLLFFYSSPVAISLSAILPPYVLAKFAIN